MIYEYTRKGTTHSEEQIENQDVIQSGENDRFIVVSLADGVSTCKQARKGAEIACREITAMLLTKGDYFLEFEPEQTAEFILSHIQYELRNQANADSAELEDYSSTLASALYEKETGGLLCFNLGDGMILSTSETQCRVISMPSDSSCGCCVTTTEKAEKSIFVKVVDAGGLNSVALCSDGAWRRMVRNGKLMPEASADLIKGDFKGVEALMEEKSGYDDFSFIAMDFDRKMRKSA